MQRHKRRTSFVCAFIVLGTALCLIGVSFATAIGPIPASALTPLPPQDSRAPALVGYFIHDPASDSFYTFGNGCNYRLKAEGVTLIFPFDIAHLQFLDTNPHVQVVGRNRVQARAYVFVGNDPAQWRREAPMYSEVVYEALYPGIDLVLALEKGQLRSEFRVHPGADVSSIRIRSTGEVSLSVDQGLIELSTASGGSLREQVSGGYQETDGQRRDVSVVFQLLDEHTYTFARQSPRSSTPALTVIPVFIYGTYLGGTDSDQARAIAMDKDGALYVAGVTRSLDLPMTKPEQYTLDGDVFLAKVDAHGQLTYVSIFGGLSGERANTVGVDGAGNAYAGGETFSPDFPTLNAWQPHFAGYEDAFLLKVDSKGDLVYSTFLGGSQAEEINDIFVDSVGNVYVGGEVYSDDFPLVNPWSDTTYGPGDEDGFISIFNAHGVLIYSTYISASKRDQVFRIAVDREGYVYGTGMTSSPDFPLVNPLQATYGGDWDDCFVFKLHPWSNTMIYSTFLGGVGRDECWGLAVDDEGAAYVAGFTMSPDFPLVNAAQPEFSGTKDAFVAKLSPTGDALLFSTFLGGYNHDQAWALALDGDANVYVTGETLSSDFPVREALQPTYGGDGDAFLSVLTSQGQLVYSSFLGGSGDDRGLHLVIDENRIVHLTGSTTSPDFPLQSPMQSYRLGHPDTFIASFGLVPTPTPTPTPTPHASALMGSEGGSLWLSDPEHLTLLIVPQGALHAPTTFELAGVEHPNHQGALQGIDRFFSLSIQHPQRVIGPLQVYLGFPEPVGVIEGTVNLYRLDGSTWVTNDIAITNQTVKQITAWISEPGIYGVLGETNRVYLPLLLRE
jgi:hypothetical protein